MPGPGVYSAWGWASVSAGCFSGSFRNCRAHYVFYLVLGGAILAMIILTGTNLIRADTAAATWHSERRIFCLKTAMFFFAVATWDVCGPGSSGRILDPALVVLERSQTLLATQTTKLMLAFVFAWTAMMLALKSEAWEVGGGSRS